MAISIEAIGSLPCAPEPAMIGGSIAAAFERYTPELGSYLRARFRSVSGPEDIVQEAFVRLVRESAAAREPANTRAWLYRVVHNLAVSETRRRSRSEARLDDECRPDLTELSVDGPAAWVRDDDLQDALATLRPAARTALCLSAEGYSGSEIARRLGRSELATRGLLFRARRSMRVELAARRMGPA